MARFCEGRRGHSHRDASFLLLRPKRHHLPHRPGHGDVFPESDTYGNPDGSAHCDPCADGCPDCDAYADCGAYAGADPCAARRTDGGPHRGVHTGACDGGRNRRMRIKTVSPCSFFGRGNLCK